MTTAHLGYAIDSSQAVTATANLKAMTDASARADKAAASLQRGAKTADAAIGALGSEATRATAGTRALAQATDVATAAQLRFAASSGMARMQAQNLQFQIQDIGMMMAMGQNPFILLAQQLPQITQHGGRLNGVMGALRGTIANLFSPIGLVTTGFVLAGSAAISYFTSATDEADAVADALEEQNDLIQRAADRWGDAVPALREYANELDRIREEGELVSAVQELSNRAWEEARSLLPQLRTEIGGVAQELIRVGDTSSADALRDAFNTADRAAQDLRDAIADGTAETDDFQRVTSALASLMANEAVQGASNLQDMIAELRDRYGEAADEAIRLGQAQQAALAQAAAHEANRGRFEKTGPRLGGGAEPLSQSEFLGRFGWENVFDIPEERTRRSGRRRKTDAERAAENYAQMIRSSEQFIAAKELEARVLGMTEQAAQELRFEQDMLNQAANDNIDLTAAQRAEISQLAGAMAEAEAETERLAATHEAWNRAGERGIDLITGLIDGTMTWKDALSAAIPIIQDLIGELMRANSIGSGGGGGGFLDWIVGGLSSIFSPVGVLPNTAPIPTPRPKFASGGVFDQSGVTAFANGGIVNRPTVFPFANGIGLMGEAGPEAIMPLRRGPDGRLGVAAGGANNNQPQAVNINVHVSGARGNQEVMQMVQAGVSQGLEQYDKTLPARVSYINSHPKRR